MNGFGFCLFVCLFFAPCESFLLRVYFSYILIAIPIVLQLFFAWNIFFSPSTLTLFRLSDVRWVFCRQHKSGLFCFFSLFCQSVSLVYCCHFVIYFCMPYSIFVPHFIFPVSCVWLTIHCLSINTDFSVVFNVLFYLFKIHYKWNLYT